MSIKSSYIKRGGRLLSLLVLLSIICWKLGENFHMSVYLGKRNFAVLRPSLFHINIFCFFRYKTQLLLTFTFWAIDFAKGYSKTQENITQPLRFSS